MWTQLVTQVAASCKRNPEVIRLANELIPVMNNGAMTHRRAGRELMKAYIMDEINHMK